MKHLLFSTYTAGVTAVMVAPAFTVAGLAVAAAGAGALSALASGAVLVIRHSESK